MQTSDLLLHHLDQYLQPSNVSASVERISSIMIHFDFRLQKLGVKY